MCVCVRWGGRGVGGRCVCVFVCIFVYVKEGRGFGQMFLVK